MKKQGIRMIGAFVGAMVAMGANAQNVTPKFQISLLPSVQAGPGKIQRGEPFVLAGGPFASPSERNKIHLTPVKKVSVQLKGKPITFSGSPTTSKAKLNSLAIRKTLSARTPIEIPNGAYLLRVESPDQGMSNAIQVQVVDPPIRVGNFSPPESMGRTFWFAVNWAPANSTIVVTRKETAPFHEEYWGTYRSVGSKVAVLRAEVHPPQWGWTTVSAVLPKSMGAGRFTCRIVATGHEPSEYRDFSIAAPAVSRARYSVRYDGLRCLSETDEAGSDEPYAVFMSGLVGHSMSPAIAGPHDDVDEGETHPWEKPLFDKVEVSSAAELLSVVALLENDDGKPVGFYNRFSNTSFARRAPSKLATADQQAQENAKYTEYVASLVRAEISHQNSDGVDNDDDFVGMAAVGFTEEELRACRKAKGWRQKSIRIAGDGGEYELYFSVMAEPVGR